MITEKQRKTKQKLALWGITIITTLAIISMKANAGQGTFITEKFSCKVALADYAELQRALEITPKNDFKYKIFLGQFETVTKAISNNDCGVKNGN